MGITIPQVVAFFGTAHVIHACAELSYSWHNVVGMSFMCACLPKQFIAED